MGCVLTLPECEAQLEAAIIAAAPATPLEPEGQFPESWDGGQTFHWSGPEKVPIPADR